MLAPDSDYIQARNDELNAAIAAGDSDRVNRVIVGIARDGYPELAARIPGEIVNRALHEVVMTVLDPDLEASLDAAAATNTSDEPDEM